MAGKESSKITGKTLATVAELSAILGLTSRRIRQLAEEGVIFPVEKNAYNLADSVQGYIRYLEKRIPDEDDVRLEYTKKKAEAQLKASKAAIAMMEVQELQGKMHRSEDVEAMTADLIYEIRNALLALPGRLAVNVTEAANAAEASSIIQREVYKVMDELSRYEYDPEKYRERVMERREWDSERDDAEDE